MFVVEVCICGVGVLGSQEKPVYFSLTKHLLSQCHVRFHH